MRIPLNGTALAVSLVALAVVVAATGTATAVAVTATQVNLLDASSGRAARVDTVGRLKTAPAVSNLNSYVFVGVGATGISSPTTATLALTRVAFYNTGMNTAYANTNFSISLVKINVGTTGNCYDNGAAVVATLLRVRVPVGSDFVSDFGSPIQISPSGTKPYCVGTAVRNDDNETNPTSYWNPTAQWSGYVLSGSYSGIGTASRPGASPASDPLTTSAEPHPAGVGVPAE